MKTREGGRLERFSNFEYVQGRVKFDAVKKLYSNLKIVTFFAKRTYAPLAPFPSIAPRACTTGSSVARKIFSFAVLWPMRGNSLRTVSIKRT